MSIIEKLGVTPVHSFPVATIIGNEINVSLSVDVKKKEKIFNEMLEALIDSVVIAVDIERALGNGLSEFVEDMKTDKRVLAIEKATGKSWEEIKELL